ncbi:MAG: bifunctional precorrin-2 dehydrogenase/sirohydrochlorin ferrochelatase [Planctomycetota bacterium]|nr:bifunctional precorrin-2 dehydrogenase/sirohydrochlorin ferrochelatase [Planctomycetota bacterium]
MSASAGGRLYPVFLRIEGWRILVVGGGKVARRKAAAAVAAGALVTVVAPRVSKGIEGLGCRIVRRRFRPSDLRGAKMVFAATDDRKVNRRVGELASKRGILCNVADGSHPGDLIVPASFGRGGLRVAFSTGGNCPVLARMARRRLEAAVGRWYAAAAPALAVLRRRLASAGLPERMRVAVLRRAAAEMLDLPEGAAPRRAAGIVRRALESLPGTFRRGGQDRKAAGFIPAGFRTGSRGAIAHAGTCKRQTGERRKPRR